MHVVKAAVTIIIIGTNLYHNTCVSLHPSGGVKITYTLDFCFIFADWYHAVQALECLGLILMVAALILLFLYFFVQSIKHRKYLLIITALTFGAGTYNVE